MIVSDGYGGRGCAEGVAIDCGISGGKCVRARFFCIDIIIEDKQLIVKSIEKNSNLSISLIHLICICLQSICEYTLLQRYVSNISIWWNLIAYN